MFYVCQLRDGYMLTQEERGIYRVLETGYPYMDTKMPSQDMLDGLIGYFEIHDSAKIKTIQELADVLTPLFGFNQQITAEELKSILLNGALPFEVANTLYKVFECKYFSIYQVYGYKTKEVLRQLAEKGYAVKSEFVNYNHAYILHSHSRNKEVLFEDASLCTDDHSVQFFLKELERRIGLDISEFKLILDTIYDKASETGFYFMCDDADAIEVLPDVTNGRISSPIEATATMRWLLSWLNPWKEYCRCSSMDGSAKRALEELMGCNLFNRVDYKFFGGETISLGLYLWYYGVVDLPEKARVKDRLKDLINSSIRRYNFASSDMFYTIENDNIVLIMSPYVKYADSPLSDKLLSRTLGRQLRKMPNGEDMCVITIDPRNVFKGLTDVERRWFQYFIMRYLAYVMSRRIKYCDLNKEEWYSPTGIPDIKFTLRDSLKAIKPNFDRLFMMGAYDTDDIRKVASIYYLYEGTNNSYFDSNYLPALEFAMRNQSEFTPSEKAFLLGFTDTIDLESDSSGHHYSFCLYSKMFSEKLAPALSDDFLEKLKTIFKMYLAATELSAPSYQLDKFKFNFTYKNYVFECTIAGGRYYHRG